MLISEIRTKIVPLEFWWLTVKFDRNSLCNTNQKLMCFCVSLFSALSTKQSSLLRACLSTAPHLRFPAALFTSAQKLINNLRPSEEQHGSFPHCKMSLFYLFFTKLWVKWWYTSYSPEFHRIVYAWLDCYKHRDIGMP